MWIYCYASCSNQDLNSLSVMVTTKEGNGVWLMFKSHTQNWMFPLYWGQLGHYTNTHIHGNTPFYSCSQASGPFLVSWKGQMKLEGGKSSLYFKRAFMVTQVPAQSLVLVIDAQQLCRTNTLDLTEIKNVLLNDYDRCNVILWLIINI